MSEDRINQSKKTTTIIVLIPNPLSGCKAPSHWETVCLWCLAQRDDQTLRMDQNWDIFRYWYKITLEKHFSIAIRQKKNNKLLNQKIICYKTKAVTINQNFKSVSYGYITNVHSLSGMECLQFIYFITRGMVFSVHNISQSITEINM